MADIIPKDDKRRINEIIPALKALTYHAHPLEQSAFTSNADTDRYEPDIHNTPVEDTLFEITDTLKPFGKINEITIPDGQDLEEETFDKGNFGGIEIELTLPEGTLLRISYYIFHGPKVSARAFTDPEGNPDYNERIYDKNTV